LYWGNLIPAIEITFTPKMITKNISIVDVINA